jgi:hypothetical protein
LLIVVPERSSLFGRKKGYWDFFKACLVSSRRGGVELGVKFANNNPEVSVRYQKYHIMKYLLLAYHIKIINNNIRFTIFL